MKTLLILLALSTSAVAQNYYPQRYYRPMQPVIQQNHYHYPRQMQAVPLYGYSYGPGYYSSAFNPSPIVYNQFGIGYDAGYYGW